MTCRELLQQGTIVLSEADFPEAASNARLLLFHAFSLDDRDWLLHADDPAEEAKTALFYALLEERKKGRPVQYITGKAWFYGRPFAVDERVLIPRFDTEVLVENVLRNERDQTVRLLDLCTGSGCIAVTLQKEGFTDVSASDISQDALKAAAKNAEYLQASVRFTKSDLFSEIKEQYDVIVSNPPYIQDDVISKLDEEVKDHEPMIALSGGADGLSFYRRIAKDAKSHLVSGGRIYLEIGYDEAEAVRKIFSDEGYSGGKVVQDLSGKDRVFFAVYGG